VWESIEVALQQVMVNSGRLMCVKRKKLTDYLPLEMDSSPYYILPALVLIGTLWGSFKEARGRKKAMRVSFGPRVLDLASIFQLVYLAAEVHDRVDELREKTVIKGESGPYFSVLAGDYLYGRLLQRLCEIECSARVVPLARVICLMNDGGIRRKEIAHLSEAGEFLLREILEKEFAVLFAEAGKTGAWLNGCSAAEEEMLGKIGWHLGLAAGAEERGLSPAWREFYYQRAEEALLSFPEGEIKQLLRLLLSKAEGSAWRKEENYKEKKEIVQWPSAI